MHYKEHVDVDIPASKKEDKLVFIVNYSFSYFFDRISEGFLFLIVIGLFPFIAFMRLRSNYIYAEPTLLSLLFLFISIAFSILIVYSILASTKLKRIRGISPNKNKELLKKVVKESGWYVYRKSQEMTIFKKDWKWTSFNYGQEIVVLYDEKDILINGISYLKDEIKSPFHWFSNRKIERNIKKDFEERIHKEIASS
jgi:hypothetical protein